MPHGCLLELGQEHISNRTGQVTHLDKVSIDVIIVWVIEANSCCVDCGEYNVSKAYPQEMHIT